MTLILPPQESIFAHYWSCFGMDQYPDTSNLAGTAGKVRTPDEHSFGLHSRSRVTSPSSTAKRRPSRAGTRSVTTLTAAQLERKRANDREAQRAIRQRTKDHIESLERRIAELSASQASREELTAALQRNKELEQENAMLRSRLGHLVLNIGGGVGTTGSDSSGMSADTSVLPPATPPVSEPLHTLKMENSMPPSSHPRSASASTSASMPISSPHHSTVSQAEQWQLQHIQQQRQHQQQRHQHQQQQNPNQHSTQQQLQPYQKQQQSHTLHSPQQPPQHQHSQEGYSSASTSPVEGPQPSSIPWNSTSTPQSTSQLPNAPVHSTHTTAAPHLAYWVDANGHSIQYTAEGQPMPFGSTAAQASPQEYQPGHLNGAPVQSPHGVVNPMSPFCVVPKYEGYMPTPPQQNESLPMMQRGGMEHRHMLYNMPAHSQA